MTGWTDERVERLKVLVKEGLSASQIAKDLGGVTRNAVIGKVNRLEIGPVGGGRTAYLAGAAEKRTSRSRMPKPTPPRLVVRPPARTIALTPEVGMGPGAHRVIIPEPPPPAPEGPGLATVATLGPHMCRWPIGDPSSDDFTFCGQQTAARYCEAHAAAAYKPQKATSAKELERSLRRYV